MLYSAWLKFVRPQFVWSSSAAPVATNPYLRVHPIAPELRYPAVEEKINSVVPRGTVIISGLMLTMPLSSHPIIKLKWKRSWQGGTSDRCSFSRRKNRKSFKSGFRKLEALTGRGAERSCGRKKPRLSAFDLIKWSLTCSIKAFASMAPWMLMNKMMWWDTEFNTFSVFLGLYSICPIPSCVPWFPPPQSAALL